MRLIYYQSLGLRKTLLLIILAAIYWLQAGPQADPKLCDYTIELDYAQCLNRYSNQLLMLEGQQYLADLKIHKGPKTNQEITFMHLDLACQRNIQRACELAKDVVFLSSSNKARLNWVQRALISSASENTKNYLLFDLTDCEFELHRTNCIDCETDSCSASCAMRCAAKFGQIRSVESNIPAVISDARRNFVQAELCNSPYQLRQIANRQGPDYLFFKPGSYHSEQFKLIGLIRNRQRNTEFRLAYYEAIWGSSHRSTRRLLVFSGDCRYLGHYYLHVVGKFEIKFERFLVYRGESDQQEFDLWNRRWYPVLELEGFRHEFDASKK